MELKRVGLVYKIQLKKTLLICLKNQSLFIFYDRFLGS